MKLKLTAFWVAFLSIAACLAVTESALAQRKHGAKTEPEAAIDPTKPMGRTALRQTVQSECVPHWLSHQDPSPCVRVTLIEQKPTSAGYALIAASAGGAHYLLVPTQTLAGVDSSDLIDPDTPNFFALAWRSRDLLNTFVGHDVPRNAVGLAVGIAQTREQDQYHIHIECLNQDVSKALRLNSVNITEQWTPITLAGAPFQAMRITAEGLDGSNLYELLATVKPGARSHLAEYTLVVAGMKFGSELGFVVLAGTALSGEFLLDSTCSLAGGGG